MKKTITAITNLEPGRICAFFDKEHLYCGLIMSVSEKAINIYSETNELLSLNQARILLATESIFSTDNPPAILALFSAAIEQQLQVLNPIGMWLQLKDRNSAFSIKDIITICNLPQADNAVDFALFRLLRAHPCLFRHKGEAYYALSAEESETAKEDELKEQLEIDYRNRAAHWIEKVLTGIVPDALEDDLQTRLGIDLITQTHTKHLHWLNQVLHSIAPEADQKDLILTLRIALGQIDRHTDKYLAQSGLPALHSALVLQEAQNIFSYQAKENRLDLTALECWTIDSPDTEDIDDAISIHKTISGWILGIHIADVTEFIKKDTLIDHDAAIRTSSIYLPCENVHMLPMEVSCNKASLLQNEIRPAVSLLCTVDDDFQISSVQQVLSVIKVARRFSYEEFEESMGSDNDKFRAKSDIIGKIAEQHLRQRIADGARIVIDTEQSLSRRLIAECMVIYNSKMAELCKLNSIPVFFRYLEEHISDVEGNDSGEPFVFPPSVIGVKPVAHQAMGLEVYAQFTSPLRRYADLVNQRQIVSHFRHEPFAYNKEALEDMIPHLIHTKQMINLVTNQSEQCARLTDLREKGINKPIDAIVSRQRRNITHLQLPAYNCRIQAIIRGYYTTGTNLSITIKELNPDSGMAVVQINPL